MLTEQGKTTAVECLSRSGLIFPDEVLPKSNLTECSGDVCGTSESGLSGSVSVNKDVVSSNKTSSDKELSGEPEINIMVLLFLLFKDCTSFMLESKMV